ncbi:putative Branched-chain amino acid ABC transporter, periplasmic amino acid-binding protein [Candidatus Promineifilum breve]|uniref:Branched-chain amino acid ABC transporter, periplasmic amino acid-binding protein n=1 Tax=Candidatus Promineifilum breve TaxID=1806508 RepID=A0A160T084_9CHLR|nr:branched-chain amino acid ABC transporter substrate-binding protein [Candidatus Promineifilum breve]CUS03301.2 putative Branched-chain amino acid ABC transporter, periplasmic amino acid-binding protein [Candidatus Promineifilum breve]
MKRLSLLIVLLLLAALTLVACGGGGTTEETVATEAAPVEEEAATEEEAAPTEEAAVEEEAASMECTDELGCIEIAPGDPILVASALVISGPNIELGTDSQRGVEIAMMLRPEVLGHPVELQAEDDGCSAEGGQTAGTKIVANPQVIGIIGTSCSGAGVPLSSIMSDAGFLMISPSNTSPALTDPDQAWNPGYFRTAHNDLIQGAAMASFAFNELGLTKAAAIHDGDPYTEGLARAFYDAFIALGGEGVGFEAEAADATNVEPLLTSIAAAEPEFLFYPVFQPLAPLLTNTARTIPGLENTILAAADGVFSPSFLEATPGSSEGMYLSGPDLSFENTFYSETFVPMYVEEFGSEPTNVYHAHAFDATNILLNAVEEVAQQGEDGTLLIGRQALRDAVAATSGYEGVTGTLTCSEFGDCADARIAVSHVEDGEFVPVWNNKEAE